MKSHSIYAKIPSQHTFSVTFSIEPSLYDTADKYDAIGVGSPVIRWRKTYTIGPTTIGKALAARSGFL